MSACVRRALGGKRASRPLLSCATLSRALYVARRTLEWKMCLARFLWFATPCLPHYSLQQGTARQVCLPRKANEGPVPTFPGQSDARLVVEPMPGRVLRRGSRVRILARVDTCPPRKARATLSGMNIREASCRGVPNPLPDEIIMARTGEREGMNERSLCDHGRTSETPPYRVSAKKKRKCAKNICIHLTAWPSCPLRASDAC